MCNLYTKLLMGLLLLCGVINAFGQTTVMDFLKRDAAIPTKVESRGTFIPGVNDDFENEFRFGNGSYAGNGIEKAAEEFKVSTGSDITLTAFLEGFYLGGGTMINNLQLAYEDLVTYSATQCDTVEINLWNPIDLANPLPNYSRRVVISTSGIATAFFPGVSGFWWLAVKHRNHLET